MKDFKFDFKDYRIEVKHCLDAPDPNDMYDGFGLVFSHKRFERNHKHRDMDYWYSIWKLGGNEYHYFFPVVAHIHSDVQLQVYTDDEFSKVSRGFDDSFGGFLIVHKLDFPIFEDAHKLAQNVIKEWNDYLIGNVYDYKVFEGSLCEHCGQLDLSDAISEDCIVYGEEPLNTFILEDFAGKLGDNPEDFEEFGKLLAEHF